MVRSGSSCSVAACEMAAKFRDVRGGTRATRVLSTNNVAVSLIADL